MHYNENVLIFFTLLIKILPLYILIAIGFIGGKYFHVNKEWVANLLIYVIAPIIFFNTGLTTKLSVSNLSFPILIFILCFLFATTAFFIGTLLWKDGTVNLFAYSTAVGNIGFFGLPVAIAVLPKVFVDLYILGILGNNIFDVSIGYFLIARSRHTVSESILRVLMLPTLYAFFLGIVLQLLHVSIGGVAYLDVIAMSKDVFVVFGMGLVGLGIASLSSIRFDFTFIGLLFIAKFILWPGVALLLIFLDKQYSHFYSQGFYNVLIILSIIPVAANSVAYSTMFHLHPQKAAFAVFSTTLFALFYVPFVVTLFVR